METRPLAGVVKTITRTGPEISSKLSPEKFRSVVFRGYKLFCNCFIKVVEYSIHENAHYVKSGVLVTIDVIYLCANFSLPRPFCSRVRPDVRDRQTDVRRQTKSSLNVFKYFVHPKNVRLNDSCVLVILIR